MGLESSEFPWKPFLWPSPHVTSQVGCNQTPTGQRMSSQTAILGFHPNCLHFLFKLVISPQVFLLPIRRFVGREKVGTGTQTLPGPLGAPPHCPESSGTPQPQEWPPLTRTLSWGPAGPQREEPRRQQWREGLTQQQNGRWRVGTTVQSELGRLILDLFQEHTFQWKEMGAGPEQPMISKYSQQRLWDSGTAGDVQGVRLRGSRRLSPALAW